MTNRRGYTLVELACVLGIAGVLVSVAIPSFDTLSRNERRTAVVNDLLVTLRVARSEALKRGGRPIVICGVEDPSRPLGQQGCAGHEWTAGWALGTWSDDDADARVDADEFRAVQVFTTGAPGRLTVRAGNFMATPPVDPPGTLVVKSLGKRSSNGSITVCDDRGPGEARAVIVSSLARARVSSRKANGTPLLCPD